MPPEFLQRFQLLLKRIQLPSELISADDPRFEPAKKGDKIITEGRCWRILHPLIALTILFTMVNLTVALGGKAAYAIISLPPLVVYLIISRSRFPCPPWTLDYRPPILVLRSHTDERVKLGARLEYEEMDPQGPARQSHILDLSCALWDWGRVVLLRQERMGLGARLQVLIVETKDLDWVLKFEEIGRGAWVILMFPSSTPGCLEEMRLLASNLPMLRKTIVFMPPTGAGISSYFAFFDPNYAKEWDELVQEIAPAGFHLPNYDPRGMLYMPNPDFSIAHMIPLNHKRVPWQLMVQLVPNPRMGVAHLADLIGDSPAYESWKGAGKWGQGGMTRT